MQIDPPPSTPDRTSGPVFDEKDSATPGGVSNARRRFIRSGPAAATVLVGTLASKPVLGQSVPYLCTLSGQTSGNLSPATNRDATPVCSSLGSPPSTWCQPNKGWPASVSRGTVPTCTTTRTRYKTTYTWNPKVPSLSSGSVFNGLTFSGVQFINAFYTVPTNDTKSIRKDGGASAWPTTLLELLSNTSTGDERLNLGRAAAANLLNALAANGDQYKFPLTPAQVITMFNAVCNGAEFQINATKRWTRTQVLQYFQALYSSSSLPI